MASYLIIFPISCVKKITALAKYSVFALGAIAVITVTIIFSGSRVDPLLKGSHENVFSIFKPAGVSGAIGTLCFAYVW